MDNHMPRFSAAAGLAVALILLALLGLNTVEVVRGCEALRPVSRGQIAPDFQIKALDGKSVSLAEFKGRVVLISFWATWCGPCIKELPLLKKLQEEHGQRGLKILAINTEGDPAKVRSFVKDTGLDGLTILLDNGEAAARYGVQTLPHLLLIDRTGQVLGVHSGAAMEQALQKWVAKAL